MRMLLGLLLLCLHCAASAQVFLEPTSAPQFGGQGAVPGVQFTNGDPGPVDVGPRSAFDGASELFIVGTVRSGATPCATVTKLANYLTTQRWQRQFCGAEPTFG